MSGIGKNSTGYTKVDYQESKLLALGFKKLKFAHQANAGDTGISFSSMTTPAIMLANGFVQPSLTSLVSSDLSVFKNNLYLTSTARGPLECDLDYEIGSASRINFIGFTALQDEVFVGKIDPVNLVGNLVVDGSAQPATGILPVGQTQFNVGLPFEINKYPNLQVGSVMVHRNGKLQVRNFGNSVSGVGNYFEVPVAGGFGSLIQFNIPGVLLGDGSEETIVVTPNGFLVERPQTSMLATIQNLQGQLDSVVPTVAALSGQPITNFQIAPNDPDLSQFGNIVLGILNLSIPYVSPWTPYTSTLTNFGGSPTQTFFFRQVGENIEIQGFILLGGAFSSFPTVTIPTTMSIDYSKLPNTTSNIGISRGNQGGSVHLGDVVTAGGNAQQLFFDGPNGQSTWSPTVPVSWGTSDTIQLFASVPIIGLTATKTIKELLGL